MCPFLSGAPTCDWREYSPACEALTRLHVSPFPQEPDRQYMHIGTMVEFAFALVAKLDAINKHSFNDFKLRVGTLSRDWVSAVAEVRRKDEFPGNADIPCVEVGP